MRLVVRSACAVHGIQKRPLRVSKAPVLRAKALSVKVSLHDPGRFVEAVSLVVVSSPACLSSDIFQIIGIQQTRTIDFLCSPRAWERVASDGTRAHCATANIPDKYSPRPIPILRKVPSYFRTYVSYCLPTRHVRTANDGGRRSQYHNVKVSPYLYEQTRYNICVHRIGTPNVHVERVYGFVFFFSNI